MSSNKKPPLPTGVSIISKRPELFCLNFKHTKKKCDEYNLKQETKNKQIWDDFNNKLAAWEKLSN